MVVIEKVNKRLGNKLRRLRVGEGKTQEELARLLGISTSSIGMYEIGTRVPSDKVKKQYSLYFDKTVDEIFF
ncbi:helix-turn-helix transcriptional regulator [Anaerococcus sp. AGMB00486]|uniref:Helix-turn-helix transcriptional regulator n=1 Tax=Anaerococcus faecalis TaxID=2742993 RepID=A0ABX2N7X8_9FIRM|nr:helix-turn-helix transcriptional regulator [Anaerococcus faecalis]NVF10789.1 helix-turn-helix transcriptional regulator [Anaerococcus faecalis]